MAYGTDKVGYGNCVPSKEDAQRHKREMQETERMIYLKNKPSWHLTEEEKKELIKYYGLN